MKMKLHRKYIWIESYEINALSAIYIWCQCVLGFAMCLSLRLDDGLVNPRGLYIYVISMILGYCIVLGGTGLTDWCYLLRGHIILTVLFSKLALFSYADIAL